MSAIIFYASHNQGVDTDIEASAANESLGRPRLMIGCGEALFSGVGLTKVNAP